MNYDGLPVLLLPWIPTDNKQEWIDALKHTSSKVLMAHLDIQGFYMTSGFISEEGLTKKSLSKFDIVLSGHYHLKQSEGNIHYLGTQYEMNWDDFKQPKGFHVFNTDTLELTFIPNHDRLHYHIVYDNNKIDKDNVSYENKIIKVIIKNKDDPIEFEDFMNNLYMEKPSEVKVVDEYLITANTTVPEVDVNITDTKSIIKNYISDWDSPINKDQITKYMLSLYDEASLISKGNDNEHSD